MTNHARGTAARSTYLLLDSDTNQSSVLTSAVSGGKRAEVNLVSLLVDFTASADVGTRLMRMNILDADGQVRQTRDLGSVVASGVLQLALPFAYPFKDLNDGRILVERQQNAGGSVNATSAADNITATLLDTAYPLFVDAAPTARSARAYGVSNVVVKDTTDATTYVLGTDYYVDRALGTITAITGGAISALDGLVVDFDYAATEYNPHGDQGSVRVRGVGDATILGAGWTVVIEDTADIEGTNDVLDVYFHGLLRR